MRLWEIDGSTAVPATRTGAFGPFRLESPTVVVMCSVDGFDVTELSLANRPHAVAELRASRRPTRSYELRYVRVDAAAVRTFVGSAPGAGGRVVRIVDRRDSVRQPPAGSAFEVVEYVGATREHLYSFPAYPPEPEEIAGARPRA